MFSNATLHPRAEALATSAVANAIVQDGTYRIAGSDQADAVLEGNARRSNTRTIRGTRLDTLRPEELANTVTLSWTLRDAKDPTKVLAPGPPPAPASCSSPPTSRPPATTPCPMPSSAPATPWSRVSPTAIERLWKTG